MRYFLSLELKKVIEKETNNLTRKGYLRILANLLVEGATKIRS